MTDKTYKIADIEKIVAEARGQIDNLKEAEALRALQRLEAHSHQVTDSKLLQAQLQSIVAYKRFMRLTELDNVITQWLDTAFEMAPEDQLINDVYIKIYMCLLQKPLLPEQFPQIRETDHGNMKKKLANDYLEIANEFFEHASEYESFINIVIHAARRLYDDEKLIAYEGLLELLQRMKKQLRSIAKSTEAYSQSVKGIYYSQAQLTELKASINELDFLRKQWQKAVGIDQLQQKTSDIQALDELNKMVGLSEVKGRVKKLYHYLMYQKMRKEKGFQLKDELSLNMILTGNPGTGKTTLARLLAKIYFELGMLPREEVIEVDRSHLVGGYVGQTEENTMNVIKEAVGGVLFIDEAYSLKRDGSSGSDYGQTVIDTLVSAMTNSELAGKFAVILAGYPEEMRQFLWSNPGLRSRFSESNHIHLSDYTSEELVQIAELVALDNDFTFSEDGIVKLAARIEREQVDSTFGNARTVKNIVLDAIFQKGSSVSMDNSHLKSEDFTILTGKDVGIHKEDTLAENGIDRLERLIGLGNVKAEVKSLVSFVKVQQLRQEKKLPTIPLQLHSVFTGDPGTGKTTVAAIFAQILKELGLLKRGHLIVAGRGDLVAGFTGQTALKTKKKIREALGGVLFIDEAYSLLGGQGDFGKEAVNTLVEEMTKHNEDLVVILAGYPKEIELLLQANPGLSSRFKKYIHFINYTIEELVSMVMLNAKKYGYTLSEDVSLYLQEQIAQLNPAGNGRFAADLIDKVILHHSYRVMDEKTELTEQALTTLLVEDFKKVLQRE